MFNPQLETFSVVAGCGSFTKAAGTGNWRDGKRFSSSASQTDVNSWVQGLGLAS